ncbi:hypothetical protein NE237_017402 [Protea cynaroides]|uniref:Retrotransposon gag domain-containing protein n=1 Tax=Protea cynaroides TaxID=273540 RepID=A0A9Q0K7Z4_9MAGN|nr:hypothetical protein NE237_017402 [Protea cynaroides]
MDKQVPLIIPSFGGRAAGWWQALKQRRQQLGKAPIRTWDELKCEPRREFLHFILLPAAYVSRLHKLVQGTKSVAQYTDEFYKLLSRNSLKDTPEQLVARYLTGLKPSIQDTLLVHTFYSDSQKRAPYRAVPSSGYSSAPAPSKPTAATPSTPISSSIAVKHSLRAIDSNEFSL